jgi:uncharacterized membrane protein
MLEGGAPSSVRGMSMCEEQVISPAVEREGERPQAGLVARVVATAEGKILLAGLGMIALWAGLIVVLQWRGSPLGRQILGTTTSHFAFGRAAGISQGHTVRMPLWVNVTSGMYIETFLTFISYPLFVLSYNKLLVLRPLEVTLGRAREAAEAHRSLMLKLGIPGLLFFVWFPLWMTGPVVGCVIGYLIGLPTLVNLVVVLSSTYLAVLCWGLLLHQVYEQLHAIGPYMGLIFLGVIIAIAVTVHVVGCLRRRRSPSATTERLLSDTEGHGQTR